MIDESDKASDDSVRDQKKFSKDEKNRSSAKLIDMSNLIDNPSSRPTVDEQLDTLAAIEAYNKALPKRKKAKDSLSECSTSNLAQTIRVLREGKKKTVSLKPTYRKIGITDGCEAS